MDTAYITWLMMTSQEIASHIMIEISIWPLNDAIMYSEYLLYFLWKKGLKFFLWQNATHARFGVAPFPKDHVLGVKCTNMLWFAFPKAMTLKLLNGPNGWRRAKSSGIPRENARTKWHGWPWWCLRRAWGVDWMMLDTIGHLPRNISPPRAQGRIC